jgi:luciferase-like monooxygenase
MTAEEALAFVREHGVVLVSAKGTAPRLTEAIIGEPIKGSWWAHAQSHHIYAILEAVAASGQILVCRLVNGKITLVHRRLWPSLVRLAKHFRPEQLAQVREEHAPSGRHVSRAIPFPQWVPPEVAEQAKTIGEQEALAAFGAWLPAAKRVGPEKSGVGPISLVEQLRAAVSGLPGVEQGPSRFGSHRNQAWSVAGREFAHLHAGDLLDLRLPRSIQANLRSDPRAHFRKSVSDWLEFEFHTPADVAYLARLAREAWAAARKPRK